MINVNKTKKSVQGNLDIFGNSAPFNEDHIWPKSKGGTDADINKIKLSKISNTEKEDKTSGFINGIRFSIEKRMTKKDSSGNQTTYGEMYVKINEDWYKVING